MLVGAYACIEYMYIRYVISTDILLYYIIRKNIYY